jgi:hypothetical protein
MPGLCARCSPWIRSASAAALAVPATPTCRCWKRSATCRRRSTPTATRSSRTARRPSGAVTTIWDWVNQVNAASYAGYSDWRVPTSAGISALPTGEPAEVESIWDCSFSSFPCVDPILWPTYIDYWSGSTVTDVRCQKLVRAVSRVALPDEGNPDLAVGPPHRDRRRVGRRPSRRGRDSQ